MYSDDEPLAKDNSLELRRLEKWNMELDNYDEGDLGGVKAEETFMLDNL